MDPHNQDAANAQAAAQQGPAPVVQPPPQQAVAAPVAPAPGPPPKRQRTHSFHNTGPSTTDANAMFESIDRLSMYTTPKNTVSTFVPDANHLFHVVGICDQLMNTNEQFINCSPAWLPIVSQLYVAVLWLYQILKIYVSTGYGFHYAEVIEHMDNYLRIQECPVPGPLVPFFQSLAAVNGNFSWIGDITPALPDFTTMWNEGFYPRSQFARSVPFPAVILDQLYRFSQWDVPANQTLFDNFLWYDIIFNEDTEVHADMLHIGPQMTASLYTSEDQLITARNFWRIAFAQGITPINAELAPLTHMLQLFGLRSQAGHHQIGWFQHVSSTMQRYCMHFSGSIPLKGIPIIGLGAVMITGRPVANDNVQSWIYPPAAQMISFPTSQIEAPRPLPSDMSFVFTHSDHVLEEQAEQTAMATLTNIMWGDNILALLEWRQLYSARTHIGNYWQVPTFRTSRPVNLAPHMASKITEDIYLIEADYED